MRTPHVSIAVVMAAVAIVAVDFAFLTRLAQFNGSEILLIFLTLVLPMGSVLFFTMVLIAGDLRRSGEAGPFALGFTIAGWGIVALFLVGFSLQLAPLVKPAVWGVGHLGVTLGPERAMLTTLATVVTIWTPVQLLLACLGGLLARRVGLKLVIKSRRPIAVSSPEIPPAAVPEPASSA